MTNHLLQSIITTNEARLEQNIGILAANSVDNYLPWSDEA